MKNSDTTKFKELLSELNEIRSHYSLSEDSSDLLKRKIRQLEREVHDQLMKLCISDKKCQVAHLY